MQRTKRAAVVGALAAAALATVTPTASAAGTNVMHTDSCPADTWYSYSNIGAINKDMVPSAWAPAGHTLGIQLTAGLSITGTVGGQVSGDVNLIVAGAEASVNASIALSLSASVTYSDSWTVPTSYTNGGYLHAGSHETTMNWAFDRQTASCGVTVVRTGTATLPDHIPSFWDTKA